MQNSPLWDRIQGNWKKFSGTVKEQWGRLTDDDVAQLNGEREQLAGRIQERYGVTREEAHHQIDAWSNKIKDRI